MTTESRASRTLAEVAQEIRREAEVRGDLDERTVYALAAHLDRLDRGYGIWNIDRGVRLPASDDSGTERS